MDDPDNFCCGCGVPIGEQHTPECDEVSNRDFIVTGSYATESGNIGCFNWTVSAPDEDAAFLVAETRLKNDKRRKYMGKLDMSLSPA